MHRVSSFEKTVIKCLKPFNKLFKLVHTANIHYIINLDLFEKIFFIEKF